MFIRLYTFAYMAIQDNNKPFPIRLGELKPILQQEAMENDRSLHYWVKKILKAYVESKNLRNIKPNKR